MIDAKDSGLDSAVEVVIKALGQPGDEDPYTVRILRTLVDHPEGMTAKEICTAVRPNEDLEGKERKWVRNIIDRIRRATDESPKGKGQFLSLRLTVPNMEGKNGVYQVLAVPNHAPRSHEGLWWPHLWRHSDLDNTAPESKIVVTEPMFFRHVSDRYYVRHFDVNTPDPIALTTALGLSNAESSEYEDSPHYVSVGEMMAAIRIQNGLRAISPTVPTDILTDRNTAFEALCQQYMVLLGTSRANTAIMRFQENEPNLYYRHDTNGVAVGRQERSHKDSTTEYYGVFTCGGGGVDSANENRRSLGPVS